jgi:hypothetical protein
MTVRELIEVLQRVVNQEKEVTIWNPEWDMTEWLNDIDDRDTEIVLYFN